MMLLSAFNLCALLIDVGHQLHISTVQVRSNSGKLLFFIVITVFEWTHFAIPYVAYMFNWTVSWDSWNSHDLIHFTSHMALIHISLLTWHWYFALIVPTNISNYDNSGRDCTQRSGDRRDDYYVTHEHSISPWANAQNTPPQHGFSLL